MFWLGFFNQADLHGQTLRSLFSSHLAATENVRNRNRCYLRAGIPPKFPPWGEYRGSKTFPDSSLLILQPSSSRLRPHQEEMPRIKQTLCRVVQNRSFEALEWSRFGAQLCQDGLGELRPSCFTPDESMETFPDATEVILQTCKFYFIR